MARVLIADDEQSMRDMLKLACQMEGHETFEALDTPTTISTYMAVKPDLLLLDLAMPGGGGNYVIQALRGQEEVPLCPVIVISGYIEDLEPELKQAPQVKAVLEKPFAITTLTAAMQQALLGV